MNLDDDDLDVEPLDANPDTDTGRSEKNTSVRGS